MKEQTGWAKLKRLSLKLQKYWVLIWGGGTGSWRVGRSRDTSPQHVCRRDEPGLAPFRNRSISSRLSSAQQNWWKNKSAWLGLTQRGQKWCSIADVVSEASFRQQLNFKFTTWLHTTIKWRPGTYVAPAPALIWTRSTARAAHAQQRWCYFG